VLFGMTARARAGAAWVVLTTPRRRRAGRGRSGQRRSEAAGAAESEAFDEAADAPADAVGAERPGRSGALAAAADPRYRRSVADVESAAWGPVTARGGAAGLGPGGQVRLTPALARAAERRARAVAVPAGPKGDVVGGRWAFLWADQRSFGRRAALAAAVGAAPGFLLFVFGFFDLYRGNASDLPFTEQDLVQPALVLWGVSAVALTGVLLVFKGRLFDAVASLALGLTLAAWVQGTFLNTDYGEINGMPIRWEHFTKLAVVNTLVWMAVAAAPLALRLVSRKAWTLVAWLAPVALICSGTAALASSYATFDRPPPATAERHPTYNGAFTASRANNQYILVLDMMDQDFVKEIEAEQPDFFSSRLDGFTQFDSNISNYTRTFPSAADMVTGVRYLFDEPREQYFARAYREGTFLPALRAAGYSTNIYATNRFSYYKISDIDGLADNVEPLEGMRLNRKKMLKGMLTLDAFRYAPHNAKATFWSLSDPFARVMESSGENPPFSNDNHAFHQRLQESGIKLEGDQPRFSYIHLDGAHYPAMIDRNAKPVETDSVSLSEQARGAFVIAFDFIDELKRIGAYKDASIVITADHGRWLKTGDAQDMPQPRLTALFVKPAGVADEPLKHSAAPTEMANVRATLLADAGVEDPDGHPTVFEVDPASKTPRDFFYLRGNAREEALIDRWQVEGDSRDWSNWHFQERFKPIYWGD
jgi:hypothetical protein